MSAPIFKYGGALVRLIPHIATDTRWPLPAPHYNRISYGCINVPVAFHENFIHPIFAIRRALVYVLPDIKSAQAVFKSYDVATAHRTPPLEP